MPCNYFNMEKFYKIQEKAEAKKKNITNMQEFYQMMKKECGVKETNDQTCQSGEQT